MRAFQPRREHPALHGISADEIARICGCHVTTARRWKRGEMPPYAALKWIELCSTGNLELIAPEWAGWKIREGKLIDGAGQEFKPGEIMGIPFLRQLISHYQREQELPRQADWVEGRYVPAREISSM